MDFLLNSIDFQEFLDMTGEVCPKIEISVDAQNTENLCRKILTKTLDDCIQSFFCIDRPRVVGENLVMID